MTEREQIEMLREALNIARGDINEAVTWLENGGIEHGRSMALQVLHREQKRMRQAPDPSSTEPQPAADNEDDDTEECHVCKQRLPSSEMMRCTSCWEPVCAGCEQGYVCDLCRAKQTPADTGCGAELYVVEVNGANGWRRDNVYEDDPRGAWAWSVLIGAMKATARVVRYVRAGVVEQQGKGGTDA